MKFCPQCRNEFEEKFNFCLQDGTPLVNPDFSNDSDEQETMMRSNQPVIEDNTIAMQNEQLIGDETIAINQETIDQQQETVTEESAMQTEEWLGETPSEQWRQQFQPEIEEYASNYEQEESDDETDDEEAYAAAQIPINQGQTSQNHQEVQAEESKSHLGIIIGGLAVAGLLLLGTAIGGVYLLYQSQFPTNEIASKNTNQEANSESNSQNENSDSVDTNIVITDDNSDKTVGNTDPNNTESSDNKDKDKTTKEKETPKPKEDVKKDTPTPKPTVPKDKDKPNQKIDDNDPPPPPPTPRTTPPKTNVPNRISGGVVNGKAISLPKPAYPAAARAINAKGSVSVAVVISKSGSVMSANAVSGHPLLRSAAVAAARRARFAPTILSGQPVEVSGVIVYNFQ